MILNFFIIKLISIIQKIKIDIVRFDYQYT
jgi:hypothetical protein